MAQSKDEATDSEENIFKYKETSNISPLSVDQTINYTSDHTSAPLYKWNDEVSLPIPMPQIDEEQIKIETACLHIYDIEVDVWKSYSEMLVETYETNYSYWTSDSFTESIEKLDYTDVISYITVISDEFNYIANLQWIPVYEDPISGEIKRNVMQLTINMGNQEKHNDLTNSDVMDMVIQKMGVEKSAMEGGYIVDVTSHSNIIDGFGVYYVYLPFPVEGLTTETEDGRMTSPSSALCVLKDGEMVYFDYDVLIYENSISMHNEVEFMEKDGIWEMYILRYLYNNLGQNLYGEQVIDRYVLKDDVFVFDKTFSTVDDLNLCKAASEIITFEKMDGVIDIYQVNQIYEDGNFIVYWKEYELGDKIGSLNLQ